MIASATTILDSSPKSKQFQELANLANVRLLAATEIDCFFCLVVRVCLAVVFQLDLIAVQFVGDKVYVTPVVGLHGLHAHLLFSQGVRYNTKAIFDGVIKMHVAVSEFGEWIKQDEDRLSWFCSTKRPQTDRPTDRPTHQPHKPPDPLNRQVCYLADPSADVFLKKLAESLVKVDWHVRGKYGPLCCVAAAVGARCMLGWYPDIPQDILRIVGDRAVAPYVSR